MFEYFNPMYPEDNKSALYIDRINRKFKEIIENAGGKLDENGHLIKEGDINNKDYLNLLTLFSMQIPDKDITIYGFDYESASVYDKSCIKSVIKNLSEEDKKTLSQFYGISGKTNQVKEIDEKEIIRIHLLLSDEDQEVLNKYYGIVIDKNGIIRKNQKHFYYRSQYISNFIIYMQVRFFRGLTPSEFEQNEEFMEEFNKVRTEIKYEKEYGKTSEAYDDMPSRERIFNVTEQQKFIELKKHPHIAVKNDEEDEEPVLLKDLTKIDELSPCALKKLTEVTNALRKIKRSHVKRFVLESKLLRSLSQRDKDMVLTAAAWQLVYEDEENKEKLSYILDRK